MNLSDKELDRLSREAAEKYEVEKDLGAWNKLEQLLNKEMGRSSPVPRFIRPGNPFIYFPALAILIGSIYFIAKPFQNTSTSTLKNYSSIPKKNSTSDKMQAETDSAENNTVNKKIASINNADVKNSNNTENKTLTTKENISESKKINERAVKNNVEEKNTSEKINTSRVLINNKNENTVSLEKNKPGKVTVNKNTYKPFTNLNGYAQINNGLKNDKNSINKNHPVKNKNLHSADINNNTENNNSLVEDNNRNLIKPSPSFDDENLKLIGIGNIQSLHNNNYTVHDSILKNLSAQDLGLIQLSKNKNERKLYTKRSLQVGVLFSPDFSEVKSNYVNKVGSNFGFSLSYQLSSKFSVNSGLVFTHKNYIVGGHDFHAPLGYWTNSVHLDYVKGNYHMLEIPLNLRFDFNKNNNTTFFVSSGFSSYFMKKENYLFYYHNNNYGPFFLQPRTYVPDRNYWFSALNLSMGFETKLSNSFSLQVEPYMKLPLTGIGIGKVDLTSYGVNFSLKFAPLLSKSRH